MLPVERDSAYLWDMLDSARSACEFTAGVPFDSYQRDRKLQLAVERAVEIIGEAARRDFGEHEYGKIKHERMWLLVTEHLPALISELEKLVPPAPPEPKS